MVSSPSCPNCGAPIANTSSSSCDYCQTPFYLSLNGDAAFLTGDLSAKYKEFYISDVKDNEFAAKLSLSILYLLDDLPDLADQIIAELHVTTPREPRVMLIDCLSCLKQTSMRKIKLLLVEEILSKLKIVISNGTDEEIASAMQIANYIDQNYYERNGILKGKLMESILSRPFAFNGNNNTMIDQILSQ